MKKDTVYNCPLSHKPCREDCAWYVVGINVCAVNVLAQEANYVNDQLEMMKDDD